METNASVRVFLDLLNIQTNTRVFFPPCLKPNHLLTTFTCVLLCYIEVWHQNFTWNRLGTFFVFLLRMLPNLTMKALQKFMALSVVKLRKSFFGRLWQDSSKNATQWNALGNHCNLVKKNIPHRSNPPKKAFLHELHFLRPVFSGFCQRLVFWIVFLQVFCCFCRLGGFGPQFSLFCWACRF